MSLLETTRIKYLKYKQKYIELKSQYQQNGGELNFEDLKFSMLVNGAKVEAHRAAFDLLKALDFAKFDFKLVTSESVTGGLLWATIVNIPSFGKYKYGCFGVYATDAKKKFLDVNTRNVYTHECAKQMAVGSLKKSDASLAISVTGNAMPRPDEKHLIGEVFIGIAGYTRDGKIKVETHVFNFCKLDENNMFTLCEQWYNSHEDQGELHRIVALKPLTADDRADTEELKKNGCNISSSSIINGYNSFERTDVLQEYIRNKVVSKACELAKSFFIKYDDNLLSTPGDVSYDDTNIAHEKKTSENSPLFTPMPGKKEQKWL